MRQANIFIGEQLAGILREDDEGYHFKYHEAHLDVGNAEPISLTLPLSDQTYSSMVLFPFFDGLIPEGWLLDLSVKNWKLDPRDRMGILITTCQDCIGAVSVIEIKENE